MVTYVANVDNYRQRYNSLKSSADTLKESEKNIKKQLNDKIAEKQQMEDKLNSELAAQKIACEQAQNNLKNTEAEKALLLERVNNWAGITKDFHQTNEKQGQLLQNTLDELKKVQASHSSSKRSLKRLPLLSSREWR